MRNNEFRVILSCDINLPVTCRIESLEGHLPPILKNLVWDVSCEKDESLVGGATFLFFNSKKQLKIGKQQLRLWPEKEADGSIPSTTPRKVPIHECGEMEHLEKLFNKYERGQIQHIDWLDHLAFKAMEKIKDSERPKNGKTHLSFIVDFRSFELFSRNQEQISFHHHPLSSMNKLVIVWDPEVGRINPSEQEQLKLARSLTRGIIDRDLKLSSNVRNQFRGF